MRPTSLGKVSIKRENKQPLGTRTDEWINIDVKEACSGKWYASVDNWQPNAAATPEPAQTAGTLQPQCPKRTSMTISPLMRPEFDGLALLDWV